MTASNYPSMSMRQFLLICALLFPALSFASEPAEYEPQEVATNEGLPSSIVNGCVCVITGEYIDSATDVVIPGPEPLVLTRHYRSKYPGGVMGHGWTINHQDVIGFRKVMRDGRISEVISYLQPSGSLIDFECPNDVNKKETELKLIVPKGLTNGAAYLSGRTNAKNLKLFFRNKQEELITQSGGGHKGTFKREGYDANGRILFREKSLEKNNGSVYLYLHKDHNLAGIICKNQQTNQLYSQVSFEKKEPVFKLTTSDHREFFYHQIRHKYHIKEISSTHSYDIPVTQYYLSKVESDYAPTEKFSYEQNGRNQDLHLVQKKINDSFLDIEYYQIGTNHIGEEQGNVFIKYTDDYHLDRVKKLRAPVGTTHEPITTHRFLYHCHYKKKEILDGYTQVFDALNHQTRYDFDEEHRLTSIINYRGIKSYEPYSQECFEWGTGQDEGNLVKKVFQDGQGNVHHHRVFEYDDRGNVIKSTLHGNLTGNGEEDEIKTYTYSENGRNLLLTEADSNGVLTEYRYEKGTDLIKAKYVSFDGRKYSRTFYFYQDAILIAKAIDDGSEESYDNLKHVTERHYTYITPRTTAPVGLPEQVIEMYWVKGTKNEKKTLKTTKNSYSRLGKLVKQEIFDADGNFSYSLAWDYDDHGNLISETNALGDTITRKYDKNDNLIIQQSTGIQIENTYDFANRLICQKEINDDQKEYTTSYHYNYLGQCEKIINSYGLETKQIFDEFGRVIEIESPVLLDEQGQAVTPITKKKYDIAGHPISVINPKAQETKFTYNIRGQPTKIEYADGTSEHMMYRLDGKLMEKIEKNGTRTNYTRDPLGRILQEAQYEYNTELRKTIHEYKGFHLVKTTNAEGGIIRYTYDAAGRLEQIIEGNRLQQNHYDPLGRICEIREFYGHLPHEYRATKKQYDFLDRVTEETLHDGEGPAIHYARFQYDERGNQILVQTGDDILLTEYDGLGRPIKITNALKQETHITYHTQFVNSLGQNVLQTTTTDPLGTQTIDTYDAANRLVDTKKCNPFGAVVAHRATLYDLLGNPSQIIDDVIEEGKVKRSIKTVMRYNCNNQLISLTEAADTPEQKVTSHTYLQGQKIETIKPDGLSLLYTYDPLGRLQTLKSSDHSLSYLYEYNKLDQVTQVIDENTHQATTRIYDTLNQLKAETLANGLTLKYDHDRTGRIKTILFPDQTSVDYVYDGVDLKEIKRRGKTPYTHQILSHNLSGEVTETKLPGDNGTLTYQYDPLRRCTDIHAKSFDQHVPKNGFDRVGNLLQLTTQGLSYAFTYDDLYQLQTETGHQNHTYCFDSLSNRLKKNQEQQEHNALNQVIKKGQKNLHYDRNGNLTEHNGIKYTYDALDRLIQIETNNTTINYSYDPFNRRLNKKLGNQEQFFFYQGQEEIGLWKDDAIQELRLLGKSSRSPMVSLELKGTPYVPLHDITGNVICLLDLQGNAVERYRYTAFGESEILNPSGEKLHISAIGNPYQYASKRLDPESGLIAFGFRYYDPSLGRWITPDPVGDLDGPNLYAYVHKNPLLLHDEFGLFGLSFLDREDNVHESFSKYSVELDYQGVPGSLVKHFSIEDQLQKDYNLSIERAGVYAANDFFNLETGCKYNFKEFPPDKMGIYMNGVANKFEDFQTSILYLANLTGFNIRGVFSPSFGLEFDALCYSEALHNYAAFEPVRLMQDFSRDYFAKSSPNATLFAMGHSRGVVYVRNYLMDSPKYQQNRTNVLAIAPGGYIDRHLCHEIKHFASARDPVPRIDKLGRKRCQNSLTILEPHPSISKFSLDHSFISPTYSRVIFDNFNDYLRQ